MIDIDSSFFKLSENMMLVLDERGVILQINPAAERTLGRPIVEIVGKSILDFTSQAFSKQIQLTLDQKIVGAAATVPIEFPVPGRPTTITKSMFEFLPDSRRFAVIAIPFLDMPEEEHFRWRLALESTDAGYWGWDMTAKVIYFSDRLQPMLGYEPGEWPLDFQVFLTMVHPDDVESHRRQVDPFLANTSSHYRFECRMLKKSGAYMWVMTMGSRANDRHGRSIANGWHFDIDERKRGDERLRKSEERSQLLLQSIPDLLFVFDAEGKYLEVHTSNPAILIVPKEQIIGTYVRDYFDKSFTDKWLGYLQKVICEKKPMLAEYDTNVQAGHLYFEARLFPRPDDTVVAIIRDITARVTAQSAAAQSEERFLSFIQNCPATIFSFIVKPDQDAIYTYIAGRSLEMFEGRPETYVGTPVFTHLPPYICEEDRPNAIAMIEESGRTMEPFNWLGRFAMPSGRIRWMNTIGAPAKNADGSIQFNGISFDVTHERELAQQVQEQQVMMSSSSRLTALGEMAGGIAHEINNPLTVAHAHASRLRDMAEAGKILDPDVVIRSAQKIESVCMRISRIIAGLRSIARDGDNDRFVLAPLRPVVDDALALSTEKFRHRHIELQVDQVAESLLIECRSVQISQVLVNLLLNAQHAVEVLPGQRWIKLTVIDRAAAVEIRVSDSGAGVAPEIRGRIFDPFFTTKEVGQGTGLGLSVSASIADAHGGALFLDENELHTTFVLILQKRHAPAQVASSAHS